MRPSALIARIIQAPPPPDLCEPFDPEAAVGTFVWIAYIALAALVYVGVGR